VKANLPIPIATASAAKPLTATVKGEWERGAVIRYPIDDA
jgi:hypothetical protein